MEGRRIVIVGAGIVGLCSAYELLCRGHHVTVLDREPIFDSASCGNAGLLSIGHPPLTRPGASIRGLRWMLSSTSPLYIRRRPSPELLRWLLNFHMHCTEAHLERCMTVLCALGFRTLERLEQIMDAESIRCGYQRTGWLDVVMDQENMAAAEAEAAMLTPHGYRTERIGGAELRRVDPAFADGVAGAIHYLDSANCHPGLLTRSIADAVCRRGGTLRTDATVTRIECDAQGRARGVRLARPHPDAPSEVVPADVVVMAAGVWSSELARTVGLDIPMQGARGYHVQLEGVPVLPRTGCVLHETFVAVTPMSTPTGGQLRLAGTLEIGPLGLPWMRQRLAMLTTGARRYLNGIEGARAVADWAGYRPCTSDGMPVIGWAPNTPGLLVATGHAMMGMTLGPVTGEIVAQQICGEPSSIEPDYLAVMATARYARRGASHSRAAPLTPEASPNLA